MSSPSLAQQVWDIPFIASTICQHATNTTRTTIARLDKRSFYLAVAIIWYEKSTRGLYGYDLAKVKNPMSSSVPRCDAPSLLQLSARWAHNQTRYLAYRRSIRSIRMPEAEDSDLVAATSDFPSLTEIIIFRGARILYELKLTRPDTCSISRVVCRIALGSLDIIALRYEDLKQCLPEDTAISLLVADYSLTPGGFAKLESFLSKYESHLQHCLVPIDRAGSPGRLLKMLLSRLPQQIKTFSFVHEGRVIRSESEENHATLQNLVSQWVPIDISRLDIPILVVSKMAEYVRRYAELLPRARSVEFHLSFSALADCSYVNLREAFADARQAAQTGSQERCNPLEIVIRIDASLADTALEMETLLLIGKVLPFMAQFIRSFSAAGRLVYSQSAKESKGPKTAEDAEAARLKAEHTTILQDLLTVLREEREFACGPTWAKIATP